MMMELYAIQMQLCSTAVLKTITFTRMFKIAAQQRYNGSPNVRFFIKPRSGDIIVAPKVRFFKNRVAVTL
jgi:hypothetical protein